MNFGWALEQLNAGKRVRMKSHTNGVYIIKAGSDLETNQLVSWPPINRELLADDWELAPESVKTLMTLAEFDLVMRNVESYQRVANEWKAEADRKKDKLFKEVGITEWADDSYGIVGISRSEDSFRTPREALEAMIKQSGAQR